METIGLTTKENGGYKLKVVESRHDVVEVLRSPPADIARDRCRRAAEIFFGTNNTPQGVNCLNSRPPTSKNPHTPQNKPPDFDSTASESKTSVKND